MTILIIFLVVISIFNSSVSVFQSNEQQQLHIHSSQADIDSAFKNKHIIIIGDSISRYLYVALVYMLHHKHWLESSMLPNPVEERTYESWPIYFGATDGMFYPYHYCDCSREQMYENKYYINRDSRFFVSYLLYFGKNYPIHARWSPNSTYSAINTTTVNTNYLLDLGDTLRSCGGEISTSLSEFEYPDLPEFLLQHVANLQPNGPFVTNDTKNSFSNNDSSTTSYDSTTSVNNKNKLYAIVMSAGFWPSKFHNVEYSRKVIDAALNVSHRIIWRTTTYTQFDRKKKRDFDAIDEVVCGIPRVECMDVSWTRSLDRQYYWDDKHFKAPVYNKIVDQIAAQIHKQARR